MHVCLCRCVSVRSFVLRVLKLFTDNEITTFSQLKKMREDDFVFGGNTPGWRVCGARLIAFVSFVRLVVECSLCVKRSNKCVRLGLKWLRGQHVPVACSQMKMTTKVGCS